MDRTLDSLGKSKKAFFELIVSKSDVSEESFDELKKISPRAFQYGKANTNARYRSHILKDDDRMCCEYCGKSDLMHNPLKTNGDEQDFINNTKDYFYGGTKVDIPATVDHINPISLGGRMVDYNNLAISCEECNSQKGSFTFNEWESFMLNKPKFQFFFKNNAGKMKYDLARDFQPNPDVYFTYNDEVKLDREDLRAYLRYNLGEKYGDVWQNIITPEKLSKYDGVKHQPNLETRQWVDHDGNLFNIDTIKLKFIKKHLVILTTDVFFNLFTEIHKISLNESERNEWIQEFKKIISVKDTNKIK